MNRFTRNVLGAALGVALFATAMPAAAAGLTSDQVTAIVSLLQSFGADTKTVSNVQAVLTGQKPQGDDSHMGSTTPPKKPEMMPPGQVLKMRCIALARNLKQGAQGDDVKKLQELLKEDSGSEFHSTATGVFGPMTAKAVMKFQMKNGIAPSTDGSVGPATRALFERACGKGLTDDRGGKNTSTTTESH